MSKQVTKTKNRTTKTQTHKSAWVFVLSILVGAITIVVAPLVHIEMPVETNEVREYRLSLEQKEVVLQNRIDDLQSLFVQKGIDGELYQEKRSGLETEQANLKSTNKKKLKAFIDDQRIFGWKSPRKFWIGFGIRLPYLIYAFTFSMVIAYWRPKNKTLLKSLNFASVLFYAAAIYHIGWVFWALGGDYPPKTYWYYYLLCSIIIGILVTSSFSWYKTRFQIMEHKIQLALDFFVRGRNVHIKNVIRPVVKRDLHDEVFQEEVHKATKEYEQDMHETADEILD